MGIDPISLGLIGGGVSALGSAAGGAANIAGAANKPSHFAQQQPFQMPAAPQAMQVPQLGITPPVQSNNLFAALQQLQGGR